MRWNLVDYAAGGAQLDGPEPHGHPLDLSRCDRYRLSGELCRGSPFEIDQAWAGVRDQHCCRVSPPHLAEQQVRAFPPDTERDVWKALEGSENHRDVRHAQARGNRTADEFRIVRKMPGGDLGELPGGLCLPDLRRQSLPGGGEPVRQPDPPLRAQCPQCRL